LVNKSAEPGLSGVIKTCPDTPGVQTMFEQMNEEEKNRGTLFASEPKPKKKRK